MRSTLKNFSAADTSEGDIEDAGAIGSV